MAEILAATLFAAGYVAIAMEHRFFISKAAASIVLAAVLWALVSFSLPALQVKHALAEAGSDVFSIVTFLLTAMTLVEILVHYHFFDFIERWLRSRGWHMRMLSWALTGITFFLSAILDNLTTTIVMVQITRRLFRSEYMLPLGAIIVIAANAGGAFSPIGDVTTIMLWFAHKFTSDQVILQGFFPAAALTMLAGSVMLRKIPKEQVTVSQEQNGFRSSRSDRAIIGATLGSFLLPLLAAALHLPPYLGLLLGLGLVWLLIDIAKQARPQTTHLDAHIRKFLQKTDIESIQFFLGILLAVAALHALGIIDRLTDSLLGSEPTWGRLVTAFAGLGVSSAVIDNVPLTAAAISALEGISASLWVLLALTVGTGGSLLVIGSAAGVVAMGMIPEMTFTRYFRVASLPALLGFVAAILIWALQYQLFF